MNSTAIDKDAWQAAQEAELRIWKSAQQKKGWRKLAYPIVRPIFQILGISKGEGNDWNDWWSRQFDGYDFLPVDLGEYIELGCGPYTNTRLILQGRKASRLVCSDPLIDRYITFEGRWLAENYQSGTIEIDSHAIEELPFPQQSFDTVVMINVLDHVMDATICLESAIGLLRSGGILVVGQDLTNAEDWSRSSEFEELDPIIHPIKFDEAFIRSFIDQLDPLCDKILDREQGREPKKHYATLIYAGRKR